MGLSSCILKPISLKRNNTQNPYMMVVLGKHLDFNRTLLGPEPKVDGPEPKVNGPGPKVDGPESKVSGTEPKVKGPESKVRGPER